MSDHDHEENAARATDRASEAAGGSDPEAVDLYTRPMCAFSMALARQLTRLGLPLRRHDIRSDPHAAAFVRSVARGHETVPTVAVGRVALVNPTPDQVLRALRAEAPGLLPEGVEVPEPGRWSRLLARILGG